MKTTITGVVGLTPFRKSKRKSNQTKTGLLGNNHKGEKLITCNSNRIEIRGSLDFAALHIQV